MRFETGSGPIDVTPTALTVAGWTGRDVAAVEHHIAELAELGVPAPSAIPVFYRCAAALLTQADTVEVLGAETSGEAEPFLLRAGGRLWLGLGSDHTDRGLEATSVAHAKQICPKPVAATVWDVGSLADRLDALALRCWIGEGGTLYQEGTLAAIRPLCNLLDAAPLAEGEAMLCGTLPAIGGIRPASRWRMELRDPATGQTLSPAYRVRTLPVRA